MIRKATTEDVPRIVELGALMHDESPRFRVYPFQHERAAKMVADLMLIPGGCVLVADGPQGIVGGIMAYASQHWACDFMQASDMALFIAPDARGGSTAARLVTAYRAWAKELNAEANLGISTGVHPERTGQLLAALGAYQSGTIWTWEQPSCA